LNSHIIPAVHLPGITSLKKQYNISNASEKKYALAKFNEKLLVRGWGWRACLDPWLTHHNLIIGMPHFVRQAFGC
jgi:hypothetical protein